jgi:Dolichyl-phosphate-mannose-protein mannosyltransferase
MGRLNVIHSVTFGSSPGIQSRPPDTARPAVAGQPWPHRAPPAAARVARLAAALAGLAAITTYLFVALSRLGYPFPVEWLESNSLVEVHRILAGQPLYSAPTVEYVPDGYPPLYFAVSAAVARVLGVSYLTLRLVSLVSSLACFALLARLVQRETGSVAAGVGAAGLFAAAYSVTDTWFDVGRVDSLFLALSIGGLYAARWMRGTRGAVAAGVLLAAAALTKQTGLAEGAAVVAALLTGPRRGLACVAALAEITVLGVSTLVLGLASGGWYVYYVFEQMSEHSLTGSSFGWFWTALATGMGLAACAALIGARRVPRVLVAGCAALAVEGYAALVHSGGVINDVLPAYLAVALLAGLALGRGAESGCGPALGSRPVWRVTVAPAVLVLAQAAVLLTGLRPSQAIPTLADRSAGERLLAGLRAIGGTVAVPADPALSMMAGMAPVAHLDAAADVLRASDQTAIASFRRSTAQAVAERRFSAIITDSSRPPFGNPPSLSRYYHRCAQPLLAGIPPGVFRPVAGAEVRPEYVWLPRGSGSCTTAVRLLDGAAGEDRP